MASRVLFQLTQRYTNFIITAKEAAIKENVIKSIVKNGSFPFVTSNATSMVALVNSNRCSYSELDTRINPGAPLQKKIWNHCIIPAHFPSLVSH